MVKALLVKSYVVILTWDSESHMAHKAPGVSVVKKRFLQGGLIGLMPNPHPMVVHY